MAPTCFTRGVTRPPPLLQEDAPLAAAPMVRLTAPRRQDARHRLALINHTLG